MEFAALWRSFGAEVTIIEALHNLIPNEEDRSRRSSSDRSRSRGIASQARRARGAEQTERCRRDRPRLASQVRCRMSARRSRTRPGHQQTSARRGRHRARPRIRLRSMIVSTRTQRTYTQSATSLPASSSRTAVTSTGSLSLRTLPARTRAIVEDAISQDHILRPEVASVGYSEPKAIEMQATMHRVIRRLPRGQRKELRSLGRPSPPASRRSWRQGRPHPRSAHRRRTCRRTHQRGPADGHWEATPTISPHSIHAHPSQNEVLGEAFLELAGSPLHTL